MTAEGWVEEKRRADWLRGQQMARDGVVPYPFGLFSGNVSLDAGYWGERIRIERRLADEMMAHSARES